jgi:hypothetical protein
MRIQQALVVHVTHRVCQQHSMLAVFMDIYVLPRPAQALMICVTYELMLSALNVQGMMKETVQLLEVVQTEEIQNLRKSIHQMESVNE